MLSHNNHLFFTRFHTPGGVDTPDIQLVCKLARSCTLDISVLGKSLAQLLQLCQIPLRGRNYRILCRDLYRRRNLLHGQSPCPFSGKGWQIREYQILHRNLRLYQSWDPSPLDLFYLLLAFYFHTSLEYLFISIKEYIFIIFKGFLKFKVFE
jgi:hypothetical protein